MIVFRLVSRALCALGFHDLRATAEGPFLVCGRCAQMFEPYVKNGELDWRPSAPGELQ